MLEIIINQPNFSHKSKAVGSGTITVRIAEIAFVDFVSTPSPFNLLMNMPTSRVAPTKIKSIYGSKQVRITSNWYSSNGT